MAEPPPSALARATGGALVGAIVDLAGLDGNAVPCVPAAVCRPAGAATLLFSDEPETVSLDGVLYADYLAPGQRYRVYVYHVNGGGAPRKFPVVVLNEGGVTAAVTITRRGVAGATNAYLQAGRTAALGWATAMAPTTVQVPPGTRVLLDADLDGRHATAGELVHAIYDLEADAALKLSVVSVGATADAAAVTAGLSVVPSDGLHVRGTFPGADLDIVMTSAWQDGVRHLRLGGDVVDPDLTGVSLVDDGAPVTLRGNFGVRYRLLGISASTVLVNPRAGAWAGVAVVGDVPLLLPDPATAVSDNTTAAFAGSAIAEPVELLTAGSSSLPIHALFWPDP